MRCTQTNTSLSEWEDLRFSAGFPISSPLRKTSRTESDWFDWGLSDCTAVYPGHRRFGIMQILVTEMQTGFSHCTKRVPFFSGSLVEKGVLWLNRNPFWKVRTHFYYDASTYDRYCDRRVVEPLFLNRWHTERQLGCSGTNVYLVQLHTLKRQSLERVPLKSKDMRQQRMSLMRHWGPSKTLWAGMCLPFVLMPHTLYPTSLQHCGLSPPSWHTAIPTPQANFQLISTLLQKTPCTRALTKMSLVQQKTIPMHNPTPLVQSMKNTSTLS